MKRKIFLPAVIFLLCITIAGIMSNMKMTDADPEDAAFPGMMCRKKWKNSI